MPVVRGYHGAVNFEENLVGLALVASVLGGFVLFMSAWGCPPGSRARRNRRWIGIGLVVVPLVVVLVMVLQFGRAMGELSHH